MRQGLDLVAGADHDALGQVAGAEALRAVLELADRHDHAPGQEGARHGRQQHAEAHQRRWSG